jgi:hypothetical protein
LIDQIVFRGEPTVVKSCFWAGLRGPRSDPSPSRGRLQRAYTASAEFEMRTMKGGFAGGTLGETGTETEPFE